MHRSKHALARQGQNKGAVNRDPKLLLTTHSANPVSIYFRNTKFNPMNSQNKYSRCSGQAVPCWSSNSDGTAQYMSFAENSVRSIELRGGGWVYISCVTPHVAQLHEELNNDTTRVMNTHASRIHIHLVASRELTHNLTIFGFPVSQVERFHHEAARPSGAPAVVGNEEYILSTGVII
ncbi:hypothetical protein BaRGS_00023814 [Batillaria attramentaria]|uniref:Uncharacterized protein n=1 Tax=Batillaria attramentaria TaxID=370345 RepID=A0ABD0KCM8_9CAEN